MNALDETIRKKKKRMGRRVLIGAAAAALLTVALILLTQYTDFALIMPEKKEIAFQFRVDGQSIKQRIDGEWEDFTALGIELDRQDGDAGYDTYRQWLTDISDMQANAVRVHEIMPASFYQALADHNADGARLLLLQGIELEDETFAQMPDAESGQMVKQWIAVGQRAINAVHGKIREDGYIADVSEDTLGYIVGDHWDSDFVQYTDDVLREDAGKYQGTYAAVWDVGDAVETKLAEIIDRLFAYETKKYAQQHLIGIGNAQNTDLLFHDVTWGTGNYENLTHVNTMHVSPTKRVRTGIFAAYSLEMGVYNFMSFDPAYAEFVDSDGKVNPARGYLDALYYGHTIPVMISGLHISSAWGVSGLDAVKGYNRGGLTEKQQADALTTLAREVLRCGMSGVCAGYYLDRPERIAWNRKSFVEQQRSAYWLDALDSEQSLGILALEPGASEADAVCMVDGKCGEWTAEDTRMQSGGVLLQTRYDAKYLYLHVRIEGYDVANDVTYLCFDTTPLSGARSDEAQQLDFDRDMDFVLSINGKKRARLMVQEYSEKTNAVYSRAFGEPYWFVRPPQRDSTTFVPILQYQRETIYPQGKEEIPYVASEIGLLRYGNANPAAKDFDNLAGYCIDGEDIEIRIPWGMLNFSDPSGMQILGDLYQPNGQPVALDEFYVELILNQQRKNRSFGSAACSLKGWNEKPVCYTRKKAAYAALQALYTEEQA